MTAGEEVHGHGLLMRRHKTISVSMVARNCCTDTVWLVHYSSLRDELGLRVMRTAPAEAPREKSDCCRTRMIDDQQHRRLTIIGSPLVTGIQADVIVSVYHEVVRV